MRFYQYKPAEYVNVHPDIPLEWMQGQVNTAQKRYDLQKEAVDKATENWLNVKYGELGKAEYDRLKQQYEGRFTSVNDMLNVGNVMGASKDFSNLIRETAMDPGLKNLQEEYKAYSEYQKNVVNPEFAGSVNPLPYAIQAGLQMGEELPLSQALQYYQLAKPQNSLEDIEKTVQSLKASTIDGKNWTINDPLTGQPLVSGDEEYVKGVSKARIKETLDSYYNNWVISGKSLNDKRRILQEEGLDPIKDMGIFNTPQGKQLYDKYSNFLLGYAYEEKTPITPQITTGSTKAGAKTGSGDDTTNKRIITSTSYGRGNNGYVINLDGSKSDVKLDSREAYNMHRNNLKTLIEDRQNKFYAAPVNSEERKVLNKELQAYINLLNISTTEQQGLEGDLFGKDLDPATMAKAKETAKTALQNATLTMQNDPNSKWFGGPFAVLGQAVSNIIGEIPEGIIQAIMTGNSDFLAMPFNTTKENADLYLKEFEKEWKKALDGTPEGKLFYNYNKYLANQSDGKSYGVTDPTSKTQISDLVQSLFNKDVSGKLKNTITNARLNDKELDEIIPEKDGKRDFSNLSYEILLDEDDGPVLVIHGRDGDGKTKGVEVPVSMFGNTGEFFSTMLTADEAKYATLFTEASRSLATGTGQVGDFTVTTFTGDKTVNFAKTKLGDGRYGYTVFDSSDGTTDKVYGSMEEMIYGEILPYTLEDNIVKMNYDKMMAAIKRNDYQTASDQMAIINKYMIQLEQSRASSKSTTSTPPTTLGKQNPQTSSNPLGLGK